MELHERESGDSIKRTDEIRTAAVVGKEQARTHPEGHHFRELVETLA
jgi:hypothetical protein